MREAESPRVKICCIGSREEAIDAIACGASAVGLVGAMPSGPGVITDELIAGYRTGCSPSGRYVSAHK